ncbi:hypothetical protein BC936DRAFT_140818 [Jimgerdemannia flammicorona]|uniref:Uncharacterized protein n=1 Tax=Jimgerdemannia flammicorona TaxID=994334 RepID=A0A433A3C7_9FUNG|nr:hypothetical protein BC936DRAFT_140818 [Jimgerdemannia flammicorona]
MQEFVTGFAGRREAMRPWSMLAFVRGKGRNRFPLSSIFQTNQELVSLKNLHLSFSSINSPTPHTPSRPSPPPSPSPSASAMTSFEKYMSQGATILEHHPNQKDPTGQKTRTVRIRIPGSEHIKVYPNLSVEHLRPFIDEASLTADSTSFPQTSEADKKHPREENEEVADDDDDGASEPDVKTPSSELDQPVEEADKEEKGLKNGEENEKVEGKKEPPPKKQKHNPTTVGDGGEEKEPGPHGYGVGRNFEKLMEEGAVITDYHVNKTEHFTVHTRNPDGTTDVFSNITAKHFEQHKTNEVIERPPEQVSLRPHHAGDTFEKVMEAGGRVLEKNEFVGYSVTILMPPAEGEIEQRLEFFGNVSEEVLNKHKDHIDLTRSVPNKDTISHAHHKGYTFETCMKMGGIIIRHDPHPFYSVRVKSVDGKIEFYSHVSKDRLQKYEVEP